MPDSLASCAVDHKLDPAALNAPNIAGWWRRLNESSATVANYPNTPSSQASFWKAEILSCFVPLQHAICSLRGVTMDCATHSVRLAPQFELRWPQCRL